MKMPLLRTLGQTTGLSPDIAPCFEDSKEGTGGRFPYHAAPTTDSPMQREMPKLAQPTGETDSRNAPTWTDTLLDGRVAWIGAVCR